MDLLFDQTLSISWGKLERIMQAILFYADSVYLRATAGADGDDGGIDRRIAELVEIGALTTWAHEYEVTSSGQVSAEYQGCFGRKPVDRVLTIEDNRAVVTGVDEDLSFDRDRAYQNFTHLREGVSEVVQLRRVLHSFRFTETLGAAGMLAHDIGRGGVISSIRQSTRPEDIYAPVVDTIVEACSFTSLNSLPIEAVVACRRQIEGFRRHLELVLRDGTEADPRRLAASFAQKIVKEYRKVDRADRMLKGSVSSETVWSVLGALLPSTVVTRVLGKRIAWFKRDSNASPFVLVSTLSTYHPAA